MVDKDDENGVDDDDGECERQRGEPGGDADDDEDMDDVVGDVIMDARSLS